MVPPLCFGAACCSFGWPPPLLRLDLPPVLCLRCLGIGEDPWFGEVRRCRSVGFGACWVDVVSSRFVESVWSLGSVQPSAAHSVEVCFPLLSFETFGHSCAALGCAPVCFVEFWAVTRSVLLLHVLTTVPQSWCRSPDRCSTLLQIRWKLTFLPLRVTAASM